MSSRKYHVERASTENKCICVRSLTLLHFCTLFWMAYASRLTSFSCLYVLCPGRGGECWYSENLILLDGVIRGAQVRGKLCPLLWADFLKSEALQYFLNMSNVFPWLVSEMQSRLVHPFYKIGKGGKAISSWLHSQLAAELRTEIASWAAKSAT